MAMAGARQTAVAAARMSSGQGKFIFISCNNIFFFFLAFLKCSHMVCHLELCVCGGEGVWACFFFPIEVFLRAGGSHPACTRLKAKKLCSERC